MQKTLEGDLKIQLTVVDASQRFLLQLENVVEPEMKRKIIGRK